MANASVCEALWPDSTPCDHGICVVGSCVCEEGWLSTGDFNPVAGENCDIHEVVIRVLYAVQSVVALTALARALRGLYILIHNARVGKMQKRNLKIYGFAAASSLGILTSALLRVSDPQTHAVGVSAACTLLFTFGISSFWLLVPMVAQNYLEYTAKSARMASTSAKEKINKLVTQGTLVCKYVGPYTLIPNLACAMIFFFPESAKTFVVIHYVGILSAILVTIAFGVLPLLGYLVKDLKAQLDKMRETDALAASSVRASVSSRGSVSGPSKSLENMQKMEKVYKKIDWFKGECVRQALSNAATSFIFAFWPFLTHKATYQLAVAWSGACLLLHLMMGIFPVKFNEAVKGRLSAKSSFSSSRVAVSPT